VKDNLIAVAIVLVITALVVGQTVTTVMPKPSAVSLVPYCTTGSHTPEAVFLEVDWLETE